MHRHIILVLLCTALAAGEEDESYRTDHAGLVPYWLGLGPIALSAADAAGPALDRDLLGGEAAIAPAAGEVVKVGEQTLRWRNVTMRNGTPLIDGPQAGFGNAPEVAAYFVAQITAEQETPISLYWSCADSGRCWLNGAEVGRFVGKRRLQPDLEGTPQTLRAGRNILVIKLLATGQQWGASARITDRQDRPIAGLQLDRAPAGKEAKGREWRRVDTGQKKLAGPLGTSLVADQIGYHPAEEKLAIATSRGDRTWTTVELREAQGDKPVFRIPQDGGAIERMGFQAGVVQHVSRVWFGPFAKPGRYVLVDPQSGVRSFPFDIQDDVYRRVDRALLRAFLHQRAGLDWSAEVAGRWARLSYHDLAVVKAATLHEWDGRAWAAGVGPKQLDPAPHDVRGGWYDAGDPNLYTKNEAWAHNVLLVAYDLNRAQARDDLGLPESGNKVPDLVDEVRWTSDYLLRLQLPDGRVFDRLALGTRWDTEKKAAVVPTADLAEPCSGATLCAAGALAYAAAVWQEGGWDPAYAKRLLDAALLSWQRMQAQPSPWPLGADGKAKRIGSIDNGYGDEGMLRVTAAAALLRATGQAEYRAIVEEWLKAFIAGAKATDVTKSVEKAELGYKAWADLIAHLYLTAKGADAALVAEYGTVLAGPARACRDDVLKGGRRYAYGAGLPIHHWGATAGIAGRAAWMLWWARNFAPKEELPAYVQAAGEYQHYLMGRNPVRWTLASSLQDLGATRTPQVMFHFQAYGLPPAEAERWLPPSAEAPARTGVMPGYLLGGPTPTELDFRVDHRRQPTDFERFEPSIMYQCQGVLLASCLAGFAEEVRRR